MAAHSTQLFKWRSRVLGYPEIETGLIIINFITTSKTDSLNTDLPTTPKRQKMWGSEPRAGKSSKKWVKSSEVS